MILFQILSVLLAASSSQAAQWTCAPETWVAPGSVKDGVFTGVLSAPCTISDTRLGLAAIQKYLVERTLLGEVHAGPTEEDFYGLHGVRYDVTEKLTKDSSLLVRGLIHIATDQTTRLVYAAASTKIKATGLAGYLRTLNLMLDVRPEGVTGYKVTVMTDFAIGRPWFAPGGFFKTQAQKIALDKFKRVQSIVLGDLVKHL